MCTNWYVIHAVRNFRMEKLNAARHQESSSPPSTSVTDSAQAVSVAPETQSPAPQADRAGPSHPPPEVTLEVSCHLDVSVTASMCIAYLGVLLEPTQITINKPFIFFDTHTTPSSSSSH